ncbi:MAG: TlpA family protein disulfide reductase [Hydrogenophaga sp.]|uniref:TlpA family protein disulfide reductase n=1 Tax=Hydrogenophaga sp. TaxID=1904254 RepID=UPI003D9B0AC3
MTHPHAPQASFTRRQALALLAASASGPLMAANANAELAPTLEGTTPDGQRLQLAGLRGRVVLVLYWSTGCAVCRDKMRELRANLTGWQGQPFTLLGVNMDARAQDFARYETLVRQTVPVPQQFTSLWAGAPGFIDSMGRPEHLPSACLIDKQGRLVERYSGRIPPEAWDRIAELL